MHISDSKVSLKYRGVELKIAMRFREQGDDLLILLHGLGCSKDSFDGAFRAPELSNYAIWAIDFPGHGESSRHLPSDLYSVEACADVTGQVIDHVLAEASQGYRRLCLAGHSMGGAVAVLVAERHREITSLVSIDGNLVSEDCGLISRSIAEQTPEQFASRGYRDFRAVLRNSAAPDDQAWARWSAHADPRAMHAAARSLVEWSDSGKLLEQFNAIEQRAFLYGECDDKEYIIGRLLGTTVAAVPDAKHFMMVDNPTALYRILAGSLGACRAESVVGLR
jgi:pimeloyl-ACP methyl ester carboxylesterase